MSKIDELLKVPNMPRQEQWDWLNKKFDDDTFHLCLGTPICITGEQELADLAFRLRDKVRREKCHYDHAVYVVYNYCKLLRRFENVFYWMSYHAQPIHWIIAALIAKELAKE